MDLLTVRTKLRSRIGNPAVAEVTDATLDDHINDAYRDLGTKFKHPASRKICDFTTVADTSAYGLPGDAEAILNVWDTTNNKRIYKKSARWFAELTAQTSAKPKNYVRFRNYLELVPPPDDAYVIRVYYRTSITDLSLDGDEPVIPVTWHIAIVLLARWYYFDDQGDLPKAGYSLRAYDRWLRDRSTIDEEESSDYDSAVELSSLETQDERLNFDQSLE